ncbi:hypothetical protein [Arenicella xantha]|uniref:Uncharacterized protein n=1 Tax=Arenicella xantha TaxID=644221 RepID=A0A395JUS6_9GAMM|nr:hypothetical protein [Arenicella xantha]RBP53308.1 hypothetical protein DFR28_101694 [Arenicella xantha]
MKRIINTLTLLAISSIAALTIVLPANAADGRSDSALLSDCTANVAAQFDSADSIKASNITSRRGVFKAKFRVSTDGERSTVLCTIRDDQAIALSCVSGANCTASGIASK